MITFLKIALFLLYPDIFIRHFFDCKLELIHGKFMNPVWDNPVLSNYVPYMALQAAF